MALFLAVCFLLMLVSLCRLCIGPVPDKLHRFIATTAVLQSIIAGFFIRYVFPDWPQWLLWPQEYQPGLLVFCIALLPPFIIIRQLMHLPWRTGEALWSLLFLIGAFPMTYRFNKTIFGFLCYFSTGGGVH